MAPKHRKFLPGIPSYFNSIPYENKVYIDILTSACSSHLVMELLRAKYKGLIVLVVDGKPLSAHHLSILLKDLGFVVNTAKDGHEALDFACRVAYQLIITAIPIPRMDWLYATRSIRKLENHEKTPIIACTENSFSKERTQCMDAEINGVLSKPILPHFLYFTLFNVLENFRLV